MNVASWISSALLVGTFIVLGTLYFTWWRQDRYKRSRRTW